MKFRHCFGEHIHIRRSTYEEVFRDGPSLYLQRKVGLILLIIIFELFLYLQRKVGIIFVVVPFSIFPNSEKVPGKFSKGSILFILD